MSSSPATFDLRADAMPLATLRNSIAPMLLRVVVGYVSCGTATREGITVHERNL
jgi:hypothetical protein